MQTFREKEHQRICRRVLKQPTNHVILLVKNLPQLTITFRIKSTFRGPPYQQDHPGPCPFHTSFSTVSASSALYTPTPATLASSGSWMTTSGPLHVLYPLRRTLFFLICACPTSCHPSLGSNGTVSGALLCIMLHCAAWFYFLHWPSLCLKSALLPICSFLLLIVCLSYPEWKLLVNHEGTAWR